MLKDLKWSLCFGLLLNLHSPQWSQGPQQPQYPQHTQNLGARVGNERHQDVNDGNHHQHSVQDVPAAP